MTRRRLRLVGMVVAALVGLAMLGSGGAVLAAGRNQDVRLPAGQTYAGFYIRTGQAITLDGTVNGDVVVAGSSVAINGTVHGNVYAAAQAITLRGTVTGNVHLVAATVELDGQVQGSAYLAAATVRSTQKATVGGGVMAAGSNVVLDGKVGGQIYAAGSAISLDNSVGSSVVLAGSQITLERGASIHGDLKYYSKNDAQIDNDTKISGAITKQTPARQPRGYGFGAAIVRALYLTVAWFLIGLVLLAVQPRAVTRATELIQRRPLRTGLSGLLVLIATPIAVLIVTISLIGLPLAATVGLLYLVALLLADVFVALWFGRLILSYRDHGLGHNLIGLLLGLVILELVQALPYVGGLVGFVAFVFGLGALVSSLYDAFWPHSQPRIEQPQAA